MNPNNTNNYGNNANNGNMSLQPMGQSRYEQHTYRDEGQGQQRPVWVTGTNPTYNLNFVFTNPGRYNAYVEFTHYYPETAFPQPFTRQSTPGPESETGYPSSVYSRHGHGSISSSTSSLSSHSSSSSLALSDLYHIAPPMYGNPNGNVTSSVVDGPVPQSRNPGTPPTLHNMHSQTTFTSFQGPNNTF